MDDNLIEYHFDSIEVFHLAIKGERFCFIYIIQLIQLELDDLLNTKCQTESEVECVLSRYIRFLKRYKNDYVSTMSELSQIAYKLIDSLLYLDHSTFILSFILSDYALKSQDEDDLSIVYAILYYAGKEDTRWMNYIATEATHINQNRLLHKLISELKSFTGGYQLMSLSLKLLYEMGKVTSASSKDLDAIPLKSIDFFFQLVETAIDDSEETFNYEIIQFILILNEQYMLTQTAQNKVLNVISNRFGQCDIFTQNLLFMLNRAGDDICIQILILKLLYGIFTRPDICDIFYTNDLCVLVDIILRALQNLSDDSTKLRNSYLRVLKPLLIHTSLRNRLYKRHEIHKLLCSLIAPLPSNNIKCSTKKIIKSILEEWWQDICNKPVAPLLGVDVKHVLVGTQEGQNGMIMSAAPSNVSSDSELDDPIKQDEDKSNEEKSNLLLCI